MARIAFLGTGLMGAPMAANLLKAGFEVTVWNRTPDKVDALVKEGARSADTPAAAVAHTDAAVSMLSDGPAVCDVLDRQGVADALPQGALFVDCSSIPPATARSHANRLAARSVGYLDAPVSGGGRPALRARAWPSWSGAATRTSPAAKHC